MAASAASRLEIVHDVARLRARLAEWRRAGETIGLVPTMGALHGGHMSLVEDAKKRARKTVLSIFVNPAQFAPTEDFAAYPRSLEADVAKFAAAEGDLIFAPATGDIYPPGFATSLSIGGPATAGLEDRFRPAHFAGVATIVAKLLNQCRPDVAIFGEKDYQQLKVVERLVRDLDFETVIVGAPTLREADGLAMSSRNVYLAAKERAVAPEASCGARPLRDGHQCRGSRSRPPSMSRAQRLPRLASPSTMWRRATRKLWRRSPPAMTGRSGSLPRPNWGQPGSSIISVFRAARDALGQADRSAPIFDLPDVARTRYSAANKTRALSVS